LPAPFGPASTIRTGRSSAAAMRSDADGGTLNERPSLEAAERPAAIRRDLDHAVGILGVRFVERPASGADPGLDGFTVGLVDELREHGFDVITEPESFLVTKQDRLEPQETERACTWGAQLAESIVPSRA